MAHFLYYQNTLNLPQDLNQTLTIATNACSFVYNDQLDCFGVLTFGFLFLKSGLEKLEICLKPACLSERSCCSPCLTPL